MSRQEDLHEIRSLTIKLNMWREEYYNFNRPTVSDAVYDREYERLKQLEEKADFYFSGSPTKTVGFPVNIELPKIKHSHPLLSLDKTKDRAVAKNFTQSHKALLMYKLDGLTIMVEYDNGELVCAATRGNGEVGSVITDNAKTFMNLPLKIDFPGHLKITGEGIIHIDDFEEINSHIEDDKKYSTARNLASGSVQQLDSGICAKRRVYFYAFNVIEGIEDIAKSLEERLEFVRACGFDVCPYVIFNPTNINQAMFDVMVDGLKNKAISDNIPIDGLVVMYNNTQYGDGLGRTSHHYKNGIALKFQEEEAVSIIREIEWQVGRTGRITPVAVFDTVLLDNTEVNKASLHNLSIMKELDIQKNAKVTIVKKNEIIPQITNSEGGEGNFEIPSVCPVCGKPTEKVSDNGSVSLYCGNEDCTARNIRKIAYFASKNCMDIDGISDGIVERFVNEGLLKNVLDIYKLKDYKEEIVKLEGMGEKSFEKLVFAIERSRTVKLENFIAALGIPNIALSKAKVISKRFNGDWEQFLDAIRYGFNFTTLESFGFELNKCIYDFFENEFFHSEMYDELVSLMNFVKFDTSSNAKILDGKIFVITGSLNHFVNRKELQNLIEKLGGKASSSVSTKTSYLINNDVTSSSSKNKNAKKLGIPIITEEEFLKMIDK